MSMVTWRAQTRPEKGKGAARKLRATGKLPAVVYGRGMAATPLSIEYTDVEDLLRAGHWQQALVKLEVEGDASFAAKVFMIKEMQRTHVGAKPLTLDFLAIDLKEKITVEVFFNFHGSEEVKKLGGQMEYLARSIEVKCLPTSIPGDISIDVSQMRVGTTMHLKDVILPEGVETDLPPDYPICSALAERADAGPAAAAVEGEAAATPAAASKADEKK